MSRRPSRPGAGRWAGPEEYPGVPFRFRYDEFDINELPAQRGPHARTEPVPLIDTREHDAQGVRMYRTGGKQQDHPVAQAQYGVLLIDSYRLTGNREYLNRARRQAQRLLDRRVVHGGAWFYPYRFTHRMHLRYETFTVPWFSMMAQGEALSLFCLLVQVTGEARWREAADATFASFLVSPVPGRPWGVYVVNGLLWLEEYPNPQRIAGDRTYNGHNFSAYGLWNYWMFTKNEAAKLLLRGALTTSRDVFLEVRNPGWRSKYCLSHGSDALGYHGIHTIQHLNLHAITGDPFFAHIADLYYEDFPPYEGHGTISLAKGSHTGYKFDSDGSVIARKTISMSRPGSAPSTGRVRVKHQNGIWYAVSAGRLAGYHVRESDRSFQVGKYAAIEYGIPRHGVVRTAPVRAFTIDAAGTAAATLTSYRVGDPVTIRARAMHNGAEQLQLAAGDYANQWVTATAINLES